MPERSSKAGEPKLPAESTTLVPAVARHCCPAALMYSTPVQVELPGVGQNLQDHIWCPVATLARVPLPKEEYENHVETHLLTASSLADGRRDMQIMQCCIMSGEAAFSAGAGRSAYH